MPVGVFRRTGPERAPRNTAGRTIGLRSQGQSFAIGRRREASSPCLFPSRSREQSYHPDASHTAILSSVPASRRHQGPSTDSGHDTKQPIPLASQHGAPRCTSPVRLRGTRWLAGSDREHALQEKAAVLPSVEPIEPLDAHPHQLHSVFAVLGEDGPGARAVAG